MKVYFSVIFLVTLLAALLGWRAATGLDKGGHGHIASPSLPSQSEGAGHENPKTKSITAKSSPHVPPKGSAQPKGRNGHGNTPVGTLLATFELTGDIQYLRTIAANKQEDPAYLTVLALASKTPDAEAINQIEHAETDNALPNLLRAGMYASAKNWKALKEQLELAATKSTISTHTQERRAGMLDLLIENPNMLVDKAVMPATEQSFFQQIGAVTQALSEQRTLFGDASSTATAGLNLALLLRSMGSGEHDHLSMTFANSLETSLLANVNPADEYGETGLTVAQRLEQLKADAAESQRLTRLYEKAVSPTVDVLTRKRFFARMRADGEVSALEWLGQNLGSH